MRRKRTRQIRILILCLVVILAAAAVVFAVQWIRDLAAVPVDTGEGIGYIEKAESDDITAIEGKIDRLEGQATGEDTRSIGEKFTGCVVSGGNIAAGFAQYDVLRNSQVSAENGETLTDTDAQTLRIRKVQPQIIFLTYQLDELEKSGSADTFVEEYTALVKSLKKEIPDAHIFVNSILPVRAEESDEACNTALEEMCDKEQVGFIHNEDLVKDEHYEEDGLHFNETFYVVWAEHMAEVAAL